MLSYWIFSKYELVSNIYVEGRVAESNVVQYPVSNYMMKLALKSSGPGKENKEKNPSESTGISVW